MIGMWFILCYTSVLLKMNNEVNKIVKMKLILVRLSKENLWEGKSEMSLRQ